MKQTSCGVVVRFNGKLLLVHSTGLPWNNWSFPKGIAEEGETFEDAAIRETLEETTYVIEKAKLVSLGVFPYSDEKDIALFLYDATKEPNVKVMSCPSEFFCERKKIMRPEIDSFKMVAFDKFPGYFSERMSKLYSEIKSKVESYDNMDNSN